MKKIALSTIAVSLLLSATVALAQNSTADAPTNNVQKSAQPQAWKYKAQRLDRAAVDALLAQPQNVLVLDVRRPDELTKYGGFPVYLNVQTQDIEKQLAYIPKDRTILTVSNHAQRAGRVADLLLERGFKVAGATGSEDYAAQGGTVTRWNPPTQAAALAKP